MSETPHAVAAEGLSEGADAEGAREETIAELSDEDTIYTAIRHLHIAEAIAYLSREFNAHMGEASQFSDKTSIDGMRDMLASLPHMQSTKEKLSLHLSLAQQCMDRFEKSKLADQAMVAAVTHLREPGPHPCSF